MHLILYSFCTKLLFPWLSTEAPTNRNITMAPCQLVSNFWPNFKPNHVNVDITWWNAPIPNVVTFRSVNFDFLRVDRQTQANRQTDGKTDIRTDGRTDIGRQTDGQTVILMPKRNILHYKNITNLHKTVLILFNCSATCCHHARSLSRSFMCHWVTLTRLTLVTVQ